MRRAPRCAAELRSAWPAAAVLLLVLTVLPWAAPPASASGTDYPRLNTVITGPAVLPSNGSGLYYAVASGGPAETLNGEYVGNYTFSAQILGVNTAGSFVDPSSGAFIGQQANLSVGGLVNTGTYTLEINVTSHGANGVDNLTQVFSYQFNVLVPYLLTATVQNENAYTVSNIIVQILLDGASVGATSISSIAASGTAQVLYNYTVSSLPPGYHTFTLVLEGSNGLVQFTNGQSSYSITFYVSGPAPDYTSYYLLGVTVTVAAIVISIMIFAPRRPRKKKSP